MPLNFSMEKIWKNVCLIFEVIQYISKKYFKENTMPNSTVFFNIIKINPSKNNLNSWNETIIQIQMYSTYFSRNVFFQMLYGNTDIDVYLCGINKKTWVYTQADSALWGHQCGSCLFLLSWAHTQRCRVEWGQGSIEPISNIFWTDVRQPFWWSTLLTQDDRMM
jgi:hypothetical protein